MSRGPQKPLPAKPLQAKALQAEALQAKPLQARPLEEGQELIGILDSDDLFDDDDQPLRGDDGVQAGGLPPALWDQIIEAVDHEFLPQETASLWGDPSFRALTPGQERSSRLISGTIALGKSDDGGK